MRVLEYTTVLNDGTGVVESETFHMDFRLGDGDDPERNAPEVRKLMGELTHLVGQLQKDKGMNVSRATSKDANGAVRGVWCVGCGALGAVRWVRYDGCSTTGSTSRSLCQGSVSGVVEKGPDRWDGGQWEKRKSRGSISLLRVVPQN